MRARKCASRLASGSSSRTNLAFIARHRAKLALGHLHGDLVDRHEPAVVLDHAVQHHGCHGNTPRATRDASALANSIIASVTATAMTATAAAETASPACSRLNNTTPTVPAPD